MPDLPTWTQMTQAQYEMVMGAFDNDPAKVKAYIRKCAIDAALWGIGETYWEELHDETERLLHERSEARNTALGVLNQGAAPGEEYNPDVAAGDLQTPNPVPPIKL